MMQNLRCLSAVLTVYSYLRERTTVSDEFQGLPEVLRDSLKDRLSYLPLKNPLVTGLRGGTRGRAKLR